MPENRSEKSKKLKTTKADSGAQLFMSEEAKEQMRNRPFEGAEIEKLIDRSLTARMLEGKMSPKKSGRTQAYTYGDMISRAIDDKPKVAKKKYGGKVAKMKYGGMVEGYEYGGEVGGSCRGGGAAVSGTKFSGVK